MQQQIMDMNIAYHETGQGQPLVILHGWGCRKEMFQHFHEYYSDYRVISLDLPGFGESDEPTVSWGTADYADFLKMFLDQLKVNQPIVFGHSFGGRILLKAASQLDFRKMILTGSAGLIPKRSADYYWRLYTYKALKWLYLNTFLKKDYPNWLSTKQRQRGSADYNQASERMKQVLRQCVNEDLRAELPAIEVDCLLLWGTNDTATPLTDGEVMVRRLPHARLELFEGGTHYAFLEKKERTFTLMDEFLGRK